MTLKRAELFKRAGVFAGTIKLPIFTEARLSQVLMAFAETLASEDEAGKEEQRAALAGKGVLNGARGGMKL